MRVIALVFVLILAACGKSEQTGFVTHTLPFTNSISDTGAVTILDYLYYYNGGGVSAGNVVGDELPDIFLISNTGQNKLFENKGNFQFDDITEQAGVASNASWNTGTAFVDINADGLLDIYICAVSGIHGFTGRNELFINNGDGTFTEAAKQYGLDIASQATQATFFDYDRDGDLDMYLVNHATHSVDSYRPAAESRAIEDPNAGDKLFKNNNGFFQDVTEQAGILSSTIGYGLSARVADYNNDKWPDIYVANDFHENDYFYLNNRDGTFSEKGELYFTHTSRFSMGTDAGDFNDDGRIDLISVDMLPDDEEVIKNSVTEDNATIYNFKKSYGYSDQYSRNALQFNNGNAFSEVAQWAGVAATDWSWAPLVQDFNNDGFQDIFVSTGILRRPNDLDYINYISNTALSKQGQVSKQLSAEAIAKMPSGLVPNYLFLGNGDGTFKDVSKQMGFTTPNSSSGAAYADFDGDNDLDIVVNNVNSPAEIYENKTPNKHQVLAGESMPYRGFQSSSQPGVFVAAQAAESNLQQPSVKNYSPPKYTLNWAHQENTYSDFEENKLLPYQLSKLGPAVSVGDFNEDGNDEVFIGGALGQKGIIATLTGTNFSLQALDNSETVEQIASVLIDVDADGDKDLLVFNGGFEATTRTSKDYNLYLNNNGRFEEDSTFALPIEKGVYATVLLLDYDADGQKDLFIAGRYSKSNFAASPRAYILHNEGNGSFAAVETQATQNLGRVTSAVWAVNQGNSKITIVGEWQRPVQLVYTNADNSWRKQEAVFNNIPTGLWQYINAINIDDDPEVEYVLGNLGTNNKFQLSAEKPLRLFASDFDANGQIDYILDQFKQGKYRPVYGKNELAAQMPMINRQYNTYKAFSSQSTEDILGKERLKAADTLTVQSLQSGILNLTQQGYVFQPFQHMLQWAPINTGLVHDFDNDTQKDIFMAGNNLNFPPYIGNLNAFPGGILNAYGTFSTASFSTTGKQVKQVRKLNLNGQTMLLVVFNNAKPEIHFPQ